MFIKCNTTTSVFLGYNCADESIDYGMICRAWIKGYIILTFLAMTRNYTITRQTNWEDSFSIRFQKLFSEPIIYEKFQFY